MKRLFSNKTFGRSSYWHMVRRRSSKFWHNHDSCFMKHSSTELSWSRQQDQLSWSHRWNEFIAYNYIYAVLWNFMSNKLCLSIIYMMIWLSAWTKQFGYIDVGDGFWRRYDIHWYTDNFGIVVTDFGWLVKYIKNHHHNI